MIPRNNGSTELEILQNRFTNFVTSAIHGARTNYINKSMQRAKYVFEMEDQKFNFISDETDFVSDLCEYDALAVALKKLEEKEYYVLISHVIEEKSFEEIADKLGMKYKGVAAIYYRTTEKLRKILGGN